MAKKKQPYHAIGFGLAQIKAEGQPAQYDYDFVTAKTFVRQPLPEPNFTLSELQQAQDLIESLKK